MDPNRIKALKRLSDQFTQPHKAAAWLGQEDQATQKTPADFLKSGDYGSFFDLLDQEDD